MPEAQAARAANGRREQGGKSIIQTLLQTVAIFMFTQFAINQFFGKKGPSASTSAGSSGAIPSFNDRPRLADVHNASLIPQVIAPIWPADSSIDISVYVSPSLGLQSFSSLPPETLVLEEKNFQIGDYKYSRQIETSFPVPKQVQENGTLYAHFFLALSGHPLDPTSPSYNTAAAEHFVRPITQYMPKKKERKRKNLLDKVEGEAEEVAVEDPEAHQGPITSNFYHPNFTFSLIPDSGTVSYFNMHPGIRKHVELERTGARDASGQNGWYYPILFVNTFWQLKSQMTEVNSTVNALPLYITLNNLANWKFSLMASLDEGMKQQQAQLANGGPMPAGGDGSEFEKVKEVILDTNIYLLATTGIVTILHMVFEGLAFKNDISHWRKKKDNVGTSVRSILANVFMQTVIFLYLLDNSEGTSWMILAGQGFGILLEAWKITKTANVRFRQPSPESFFSFLPYIIVLEDKHQLTQKEKETEEYDRIAFKYLYIVAVPLLGAYAVYSLLYETHKGWYSFVIETLVGSVYAYGFLMMVPSLYINYRLKSVAHMPSKAMTYKFLNTFIDDLFAFTIRMPTLHRLATLRDDVIFFIWLYQKWMYRVDYSRINEFGQGGDTDDEDEAEDSSAGAKAKKEIEGALKEAEDTIPSVG
ncbi:putative clptm1 domain-containing protein [Phaeomoniella chlamydospora]|uniref:Putative clptm1 domain-containing protein n=1 Tax=Phaeomoniella chlamydospora TaxID=158046 RepID=A0A0G2ETV8_PHACM|nr:putative clptm1 domain-containing protein [Phaeomoniella chlamydospora]